VAGQNSLKPDDLPMEYLLAHFGTKVRHEHVLGALQSPCACPRDGLIRGNCFP
jgi:hypothetical protein